METVYDGIRLGIAFTFVILLSALFFRFVPLIIKKIIDFIKDINK